MAEERNGSPTDGRRSSPLWYKIFGTFWVALDPKKLLLAAAGIFAMWLGWFCLSWLFMEIRHKPQRDEFTAERFQKTDITPEEAKRRADEAYFIADQRYQFMSSLAGKDPDGYFRVAPWDEYRGPNPVLMVARHLRVGGDTTTSREARFFDWILSPQAKFLVEPLAKLLSPMMCLFSPHADGWAWVYLILIAVWAAAVWAFFGGAITRIAVVQLSGQGSVTLMESLRFVASRYLHYFAAPLVPLLFVAGLTILSIILFGLIHLIPWIGELYDIIVWPFTFLIGLAMAFILVGLVGFPLMYPTISAEGSDAFDALSRAYNYVYQSPWYYAWTSLVAVLYGCLVVFVVVFMGSLVMYLTKWSVSQTPGTEYFMSRRVDHLYIHAPKSFGWRELLVSVPDLKPEASKAAHDEYMKENVSTVNPFASYLIAIWTTLAFMFVIGFGYSYFYTAGTMLYLLMRRHVDESELDEVYLEHEEPEEPMMPPAPAPTSTPPGVTMVEPPGLRQPTAPSSESPPA